MPEKNKLSKIMGFKLHYSWLPVFIAFAVLLCSFLGYLGRYFWFFDLFSHFKVQLFLTSLICGLILIILALFSKKAPKEQKDSSRNINSRLILDKKGLLLFAFFSFAIALLNLLEIAPLLFHQTSTGKQTSSLRLMHINVNTANRHYKKVEDYILEQNPDMLLLEEVNSNWIKNLNRIFAKYPFQITYPQSDNFGIAMFSKTKPNNAEVMHFGKYGLPFIKAEFQSGEKKLSIFGVHTLPPISRTNWQDRNQMLETIGKLANPGSDQTVIILGDLNITPFSYFFKKLLRDSNLRNSQCGFGIQPSWPNQPFFLSIPIDHCLISKDIEVTKRYTGPDLGSDHLPLVIELKVP